MPASPKETGGAGPGRSHGPCRPPSLLCSYSGLCGRQLVSELGFTCTVPRPWVRGEPLDLAPQEVWPWPWPWLMAADHQALGMSCLRKVSAGGVSCQSPGAVWFRAGLWVPWAGSQASETASPHRLWGPGSGGLAWLATPLCAVPHRCREVVLSRLHGGRGTRSSVAGGLWTLPHMPLPLAGCPGSPWTCSCCQK